jgi:hypothetical protein
VTYRLPVCLSSGDDARAAGYLRTYYGITDGVGYTGSHFDSWPSNDPDRFTADDLVAVSFLSVFVPPQAARTLLATDARRFAGLLAAVGPDRDLAQEPQALAEDSPPSQLYRAVRKLPGVGRTIATKLVARKRPRLLPIYDSVVARVTQVGDHHWEPVRQALRADAPGRNRSLHEHLLDLGRTAGTAQEVSVLRLFDVITWMEGKANRLEPTTQEERLGAVLAEGEDGGGLRP